MEKTQLEQWIEQKWTQHQYCIQQGFTEYPGLRQMAVTSEIGDKGDQIIALIKGLRTHIAHLEAELAYFKREQASYCFYDNRRIEGKNYGSSERPYCGDCANGIDKIVKGSRWICGAGVEWEVQETIEREDDTYAVLWQVDDDGVAQEKWTQVVEFAAILIGYDYVDSENE